MTKMTTRPRRKTVATKATTMATAMLLAAALAGCGKGKERAGGGAAGSGSGSAVAGGGAAGSAAADAGAAGAGAAGSPASPKLAALDSEEVDALLARWVAAQNAGDFAAYEAVYAARMEGIKRVGPRTWRFDRKGWLADRARMFKRPMKVEVSSISASSSGPTATATLEQSFTQGKFSDAGTKQLIIVKEGGGLRIAREEMLRSEVAGQVGQPGQGGVFLVGNLLGGRYIYLDLGGAASVDWASGPPEGGEDGDPLLASRIADKVPPAFAAWRGRELAAYAADGTRCKAVVDELRLVAGGTPHFSVTHEWNEEKLPPASRAEAVFALGEPLLVGGLDVEGSCAPVVVIEAAAGAAAPVFYPPHEPDPAELARALKAFRGLVEYQALQREWRADYEGKGEWSTQPFVRIFGAAGGKRYVAVSDSGPGCAEFGGSLSALFEERGAKLVRVPLGAGQLRPTALFDSDGDGKLEAIDPGSGFGTFDSYFTMRDGELTLAQSANFPYSDCGC